MMSEKYTVLLNKIASDNSLSILSAEGESHSSATPRNVKHNTWAQFSQRET